VEIDPKTLIWAPAIGAVLFAVAVVLVRVLRGLSNKALREVISDWEAEGVIILDKSSNFFGCESMESLQMRGNGVLVLTQSGIRFRMWLPELILKIDWPNIHDVETVRTHLGKTIFKPLIKITFINKTGESDSAAWFVKNHEQWLEAIQGRITG